MTEPELFTYLLTVSDANIVACLLGFVCGVVVFSLLARVVMK